MVCLHREYARCGTVASSAQLRASPTPPTSSHPSYDSEACESFAPDDAIPVATTVHLREAYEFDEALTIKPDRRPSQLCVRFSMDIDADPSSQPGGGRCDAFRDRHCRSLLLLLSSRLVPSPRNDRPKGSPARQGSRWVFSESLAKRRA